MVGPVWRLTDRAVVSSIRRDRRRPVASAGDEQSRRDAASDNGMKALLEGLAGDARRDRAELIAWLLDRGFTADQIGSSLTQ